MAVPSSSSTKRPSGPSPETTEAPPAVRPAGRDAPSARLHDSLPRWIIMPSLTGSGAPTAFPQSCAIRFPAALTPVLASSIGHLGDPAIAAALRPSARTAYAALAVDWGRRRLAPSLSRLRSRRSLE